MTGTTWGLASFEAVASLQTSWLFRKLSCLAVRTPIQRSPACFGIKPSANHLTMPGGAPSTNEVHDFGEHRAEGFKTLHWLHELRGAGREGIRRVPRLRRFETRHRQGRR